MVEFLNMSLIIVNFGFLRFPWFDFGDDDRLTAYASSASENS